MNTLVDKIRNKDKRAIARAITLIEEDDPRSKLLLTEIFKFTGKSYRIGITGPPGAGKSTLTNYLTQWLVREGFSVGVIAIDPSSPFTGGAILGDRVRMSDLSLMDDVFIRSMATRGSLGGLAKMANEVADVMDAAGMDFIIFETVGVGQTELDIAMAADTVVVVLVPESGDSIQAMKAGLMEIADIFVINKSDREGSTKITVELESMLKMRTVDHIWNIPVMKTVAHRNQGIDDLGRELMTHKSFLQKEGLLSEKRKQRLDARFTTLIQQKLYNDFIQKMPADKIAGMMSKVYDRELSVDEVIELLLNTYFNRD